MHSALSVFPCVTSRCAFIAGEWVHTALTFATLDPSSELPLTEVASCSADDVHAAVLAATDALNGPSWGYASTAYQRSSFLRRLAAVLEEHKQDIANLDSLDEGKPKRESLADVGDAISLALHLADIVDEREQRQGKRIAINTDDFNTSVFHEPVGVVGAITPWNYPFLMAAQKTLPALAAGCAVVLKPSELAPLSCLVLAHLCERAGLPSGALNVVPGLGAVAGAALTAHTGVDKLSFTGSISTARAVMTAASSGPRAVSLELGGKSPAIVFEDAAIDATVDWLITGFVWGSGQVCSSTSRLLIHSSLSSALLQRLYERLVIISICSAEHSDDDPAMGPVVSRTQFDKIWAYIDEAKRECECVFGGSRDFPGLPSNGYFVPPTVFLNPSTDSRVWTEEIFGPVLCVKVFETEEEAIELANRTIFGLAAAVFSDSEERCSRVARRLRAGIVWVNCSQPAFVQAPWGGCKASGFGRELGEWGVDECSHVKQVTRCASGFSWSLW